MSYINYHILFRCRTRPRRVRFICRWVFVGRNLDPLVQYLSLRCYMCSSRSDCSIHASNIQHCGHNLNAPYSHVTRLTRCTCRSQPVSCPLPCRWVEGQKLKGRLHLRNDCAVLRTHLRGTLDATIIAINAKNFHGSLTTVVRAQNDTSKTANIICTNFYRTLV